MPYYHLKHYDHMLKRKCACGGSPQMILDIVQDYIVRCDSCHNSTNAYMDVNCAVEAWENNECTGPLDLITDDLEKNIASIENIYISGDEFCKINEQSCDCLDIVIDTGEQDIWVQYESFYETGCIEFDELIRSKDVPYKYKVSLNGRKFILEKIVYYDSGLVDAIKYRCDDTYLFIFSAQNNLVLTMSKYDLLDGTDEYPETEATLEIIGTN